MPTADQVLRAAWKQLDADIRDRFKSGRGSSATNELPNKRIRQSVLPKILNRNTVEFEESLWVTNPAHGNWSIQNIKAVEEIKRIIKEHAIEFAALDEWKVLFLEYAESRGKAYTKPDKGPLLGYAMLAQLQANKGKSREEALSQVFKQHLSDDVRDIEQLNAAFTNIEVMDELRVLVRRASNHSVDLTGPSETEAWRALQDLFESVWSPGLSLANGATPNDGSENECMERIWSAPPSEVVLLEPLHEWRLASQMQLSNVKLRPGEFQPHPGLGSVGKLEAKVPSLDRTIYQRLHGFFRRGTKKSGLRDFIEPRQEDREIGTASWVGILPFAVHMSLMPWSVLSRESKLTLLVAHFALQYVRDPKELRESQGSLVDPRRSNFLGALTRRVYYDIEVIRSRRTGSRANQALAAEAGGNMKLDDVKSLESAMGGYERRFLNELWVKLHNLELERHVSIVEPDQNHSVHTWAGARDVILDVAHKNRKETRRIQRARDAAALLPSKEGPSALLPPDLIAKLRHAQQTVPDEFRRFLTAHLDVVDVEDTSAVQGFSTAEEDEHHAGLVAQRRLHWEALRSSAGIPESVEAEDFVSMLQIGNG